MTERRCLLHVNTCGVQTIRDVQVSLEACHPEIRGVRYEKLCVWHDSRSQEATTDIPPGRPGLFAVLQQEWAGGTSPKHWSFRYANGDLNPPMPLERHEIKLAIYGDDIPAVRAWFAIEVDDNQMVSLVPIPDGDTTK